MKEVESSTHNHAAEEVKSSFLFATRAESCDGGLSHNSERMTRCVLEGIKATNGLVL